MIKFTTVPAKRLAASINASAMAIQLNNILGWDGEALEAADFGTELYAVLRNDANTAMELVEIDPDTIASGSITLLRRGLQFDGDLLNTVADNKLVWTKNDTVVELGADTPQMFQALKAYADAIASAGAADADVSTKGIVEIATTVEIDADEDLGSTGAVLAVAPDKLAASKYGLRLPSVNQKTFLGAIVGTILQYAGRTAPTGFLLCDAAIIDMDTYGDLSDVLLGYYGYGTPVTFTADAGTDFITANSHGLSDGNRILFTSTSALPAGLFANTMYFVINKTTNTFQVSTTAGGSAVNLTDTGTGTHSFYNSIKVPDLRGRAVVGAGTGVRVFTLATGDVDTNDQITVESNSSLYTGQQVTFDTTGVAPTGLTTATLYFVIRVDATHIKLATTRANAVAGTAVDITAQGTGPHTITKTLSARATGDRGGEEDHTLTANEIPPFYNASTTSSEDGSGTNYIQSVSVQSPNSESHNNMPPYLVVNHIIKT